MTYTREQLERMGTVDLEMLISRMLQKRYVLLACSDCETSLEIQSEATEVDADTYIRELSSILKIQAYPFNRRSAAKLLKATPRQRTIAAILTLQGQGGTGDE